MKKPRSLTGVIHLPDARMNFFVSFGDGDGKGEKPEPRGNEARMLGRILEQAVNLSPDMQELMIRFADYIKKVAEKDGQGHKE